MFGRRRPQSDFSAEIEAHLRLEEDRLREDGMTPQEARTAARRAFGSEATANEDFYETHRVMWLDHLSQDLRYAVRTLRHSPAFTAAAVITLALGIGANTAIFSVIDLVLLKPLPFSDPDRLVTVWGRNLNGETAGLAAADILDIRNQSRSFENLAAYRESSFNLTGEDRPERAIGVVASANYFDTFRVQAQLGRTFHPTQERPGSPRTAVLSYRLWQRRYGADPAILGKSIMVDGEPATVVGVMPPSFQFPVATALWISPRFTLPEHPLKPNEDPTADRGTHYLDVIGRLKSDFTLVQAQSEVNGIVERLKKQYGRNEEHIGAALIPLRDDLVDNSRTALLTLLGAVALLLLIASANVANIILARGATRQKEMTIRAALGAGRMRMIRQLLTESVVLAFSGAALGVLLGYFALKPLQALIPAEMANENSLHLDGRVLLFTSAVAFACGILFGLFPALQMAKPDLNGVLKETARGSVSSARAHRSRSVLVVAEIALATILLTGAGLLIRSFSRLLAVPEGFKPEHVLTLRISLPQNSKPLERLNFVQRSLEQVRSLPGITSASVISRLPLAGGNSTRSMDQPGRPAQPGDPDLDYLSVAPDYFQTLGIPVLKGRSFADRDGATATRVVVVTESAARHFWPNKDPTGKLVRVGACAASDKDWCSVIGVVGDVQQHRLDRPVRPTVYVAYAQDPWPFVAMVVRTRMEPAGIAPGVESAIHDVDKNQPVYAVRTMEAVVAESVSPARLRVLLLGVFAGLALALACVGIYGVIAYSVSQRRQEIGIRMALGAEASDVRGLILRQGAKLTIAGILIGLVLSVGLARSMSSLLFGVQATDPITLVSISVMLLVVALLASFIPAWKATRLDPVLALRGE